MAALQKPPEVACSNILRRISVFAHFCILVPVFAELCLHLCLHMIGHYLPSWANRLFYPDIVIWGNMILSRISKAKALFRKQIVYARVGFLGHPMVSDYSP